MDASLEQRFAASFGKRRRPSPDELADAWEQLALTLDEVLPLAGEPGVYPYGRKDLQHARDRSAGDELGGSP